MFSNCNQLNPMFFSECNNELRGSFGGIIESPNFPDAYPHLRDCTW